MFGQNSENNYEFEPTHKLVPPDGRYLPRWEVNNRIQFQLDEDAKVYECRTIDLSCAGACLVTEEIIPSDQKLKLKIFLTEDTAVKVDGQVIWNKSYKAGNLTGVAFDNASLRAQELILKHAFELKKDDLIKHWYSGWEKTG